MFGRKPPSRVKRYAQLLLRPARGQCGSTKIQWYNFEYLLQERWKMAGMPRFTMGAEYDEAQTYTGIPFTSQPSRGNSGRVGSQRDSS